MLIFLYRFLQLLFCVFCVYGAHNYLGEITFHNCLGKTIIINTTYLISIFFILYFIISLLKCVANKIWRKIAGKPKIEKGIDLLEEAFSGLLIKDYNVVLAKISKAKKYLGERSIISWIEGQLNLLTNNTHKAKAIFYSMGLKENKTVLGVYSLYQIAMKNYSNLDALTCMDTILQVIPHSVEMNLSAVALALKEKQFKRASLYLNNIKYVENLKRIKAIILSEEGICNDDITLIQKSYELDYTLFENTIIYADHYIRCADFKYARKILSKTLSVLKHPVLMDKFINCDPTISNLDQISMISDMCENKSWLEFYTLGKLALLNDMSFFAFDNLLKAYELKNYDFIIAELIKAAKLMESTGNLKAIEILSQPMEPCIVSFVWKCSSCGHESKNENQVCCMCNAIGKSNYTAINMRNDLKQLIVRTSEADRIITQTI